ncbi:hypothetical protein AA12717_1381 [Gluconacetobacter sacchari DSM 12717]|uniref:S24 family peptidase n=2 Tax=Gluconacetobacter sacchari TaxID=92759 RepID=A0A7W4NL25_9PROT|nr:S24 family peptidase [Gluconacetobacter sacchari]MBB2159702.1 S24 family peptidase [Gluconacetobacter sacchari]GBQ23071.1 hypothetical protein AA12717_1381 [Gluconacetobacter sacchari DSM 12717]
MSSPVDKSWFRTAIERAGYKSQGAFATDVGLTSVKITNIIKGIRRVQPEEINLFSEKLRESPSNIMAALGMKPRPEQEMPISGYVAAADRVVFYENGDAELANEPVRVPFFFYPGLLLTIKGDSMLPRYKPGEKVGIRTPGIKSVPLKFLGCDVVVSLTNGQLLLKTIYKGTSQDRFTLVSVNPTVEPIVDADIDWVAPIDFHMV